MSRKKLSPLIEAMNIFDALDERDKASLTDYARSRTAVARPKATSSKRAGKKAAVVTSAANGGDDDGHQVSQ